MTRDLPSAAGRCFAPDYAEARRRFLAACVAADIRPIAHGNPHAGPDGEELATELGRPSYRGANIHVPLMYAGFVIALFGRGLGFVWLALLIVVVLPFTHAIAPEVNGARRWLRVGVTVQPSDLAKLAVICQ